MNDLLYIINTCDSEEELKEIMDFSIAEFINRSKPRNRDHDTIGRITTVNPQVDLLGGDRQGTRIVNRWVGYIPNNVKVVIRCEDHNGVICNDGYYFYVGDDSYVYDFCKFIKGNEYNNPVNFILDIGRFMKNYFGTIPMYSSREERFKLLENEDGFKYGPIREHLLTDFKGSGVAMCTEMSAMGQNLMTLFGLRTEMIMDYNHAYNVWFYGDKVFIVDYQNQIVVYDIHFNEIKRIPFVEEIHDYTDEMYMDMILGNNKILLDDFSLVKMLNSNTVLENNRVRAYRSDGRKM